MPNPAIAITNRTITYLYGQCTLLGMCVNTTSTTGDALS